MEYNPKVQVISAKRKEREKRVAIYARVSSNSMEQLNSLTAQVSLLTRLTVANPTWLLVDVYMDIASSKIGSHRKEFNRMVEDCAAQKVDIILTKSISRFGRDSLEILSTLNKLKEVGTRVIFELEELDTANTDSTLMISIIEAFAQAENESRSENIKWGIKQRAAEGTSKLYNRKCYGYSNDEDGSLIINEEQADIVKMIFDLYLHGKSVIGIVKELEKQGIKSPTEKDAWSKRTIDTMLNNEKYVGNVILLNNGNHKNAYHISNNNPAIITEEVFKAVQLEKGRRSNVVDSEDGIRRKSSKYSSKVKK